MNSLRRRLRRLGLPPAPEPPPAAPVPAAAPVPTAARVPAAATAAGASRAPAERLVAERRRLIDAAIEVVDQLDSAMLRERLHDALEDVGVHPISADGEVFDHRRHRATGAAPPDDPAQDGRVAVTQRLGYQDRDQVLRPPEVVVFRSRQSR